MIPTCAALGFTVSEVLVEGRAETEREVLLSTIGVRRGDAILDVDLEATRARIEDLPWVEEVSVARRLPDVLYVKLTERQPMAIWQFNRTFTVIDRDGQALADALDLARRGNKRVEQLPHVVGGEDVPGEVPGLLTALEAVPALKKRVTAAVWLGNRRWDLKLDNGVVVKLPESHPPEPMTTALRHLAEMHATAKVLDRDIVAIDLRQPDRMVLQTAAVPEPEEKDRKKRKPGDRT